MQQSNNTQDQCEPCEYCIDGIEVETVVIDGVYYTMQEDTVYCPYCGRKLEDV